MKIIKAIFYSITCVITSYAFAATSLPLCNLLNLDRIEYPCFGLLHQQSNSRFPYIIGELQDGELHGQGIRYSFNNEFNEIGEFWMGKLKNENSLAKVENIPDDISTMLNTARENLIATNNLIKFWDGIKRRKQAVLAISKNKSKLPICDGFPLNWHNCFQIIETEESFMDNASLYYGEFSSGKKNGKGTILNKCSRSNCIAKYQGMFKDDAANDTNGIITYNNGDEYYGSVKDGHRDGKGVYKYKDGTIFSSERWQPIRDGSNGAYPNEVGVWLYPNKQAFTNLYANGFPVFNEISCLRKRESYLVEKLGPPNKFYELSGKKYMSYGVTHNYSSRIADGCFISFDLLFTLVSGEIVDVKRSNINLGSGFNSCSGFWKTDFSIDDYGCY